MNDLQKQQLWQLLLGAGGPIGAMLVQWGIAESTVTQILQILLLVLPPLAAYLWNRLSHSDQKVIAAVANIPGVQTIEVDPAKASTSTQAAVASPALPNVVSTKAA